MQIITSISDMQSLAESLRNQGRTIGFVPTMGFLHEGHLSLIRRARQECDAVVVSVFVNPAQFGPHEDFERYPRDEEGDRGKCESVGVDILFMPTVAGMYSERLSVFVTVDEISDILEGAVRPGHFRGVATVVCKLFNIVKPRKAYFGQKDYQQFVVIRRMVKGLNMDVEITMLPTIREQDGLAMSSRNSYLNPDERDGAAAVSRALFAAEELVRTGVKEPEKLKNTICTVLGEQKGMEIDYVEIADPESLVPLVGVQEKLVMLVAVRVGQTRLIDNCLVLC
jgi:pantoate--beta-alanine ligase